MLTFLLGSITAVSLCWSSLAEPSVPPASGGTEWNTGPTTGTLGSVGAIKVPTGYKFLEAQGARTRFEGLNQPVPKNLLGILTQNSENWWVLLQLADQGYSQNPEKEALNPADILQALATAGTAQNPRKPAPSLEWELPPHYDAQGHLLEWAVRKQSAASPVVVQTVRVLCRRGSITATVVTPYRGFSDLAPLKQLVKDISFKAGERYEDYQNGDKLCSQGLAALITADDTAAKPTLAATADSGAADAAGTPRLALWYGGGGVACALVLGGIFFYVWGKRQKPHRSHRHEREPQVARPTAVASQAAKPSTSVQPAVPAPPAAPLAAQPQPAAAKPVLRPTAKPAVNGVRSKTEPFRKPLNGNHHGQHRRKVFDYNRYFSDLMGAVSGHGTQMETPPANGVAHEPTRPAAASVNGSATAPALASTLDHQAELMANQRDLIEEQKRLIQEQNKLIEEKSRLIAEKNELLKLQSQFMDDKLA